MNSSSEDPRSKRGGHRLFDHSFFPDAAILRVRNRNFIVSKSYLALHSTYFEGLFYGAKTTENNGTFTLDFDPQTFGDILDIIYPCYKKTDSKRRNFGIINCQEKFSRLNYSYRERRSHLGIGFVFFFKALSLHSRLLCDLLYRNGELIRDAEVDVDRKSFDLFIRATTGELPKELTSQFLDGLITLEAKNLYEFYISEIFGIFGRLCNDEASRNAFELLEHYSHQPTPDLVKCKRAARFLTSSELSFAIERSTFSQPVEAILKAIVDEESDPASFHIFVKSTTGKTCELLAKCSMDVEELKISLHEKSNVPVDQMRLIFEGRQMEDGRTLGEYKVRSESTVYFVPRLRGC